MKIDTEEYRKMDRSSLWHPYTKHSSMDDIPFPIIVRGEGVYLFDSNGNRYLDAISSWWSCNLGHRHPKLIAAIEKQANKLEHSILGSLSHPPAIKLAAKLVDLFPDRHRRVLFASDGASAVEAALKIAVQYWHNIGHPERNKFASLTYAYHGDTIGAISVGFMESFHKQFKSIVFQRYQAESPCCKGCSYGLMPDTCNQECFDSMQQIFKNHAHELAAVIVEPLCQGAAGMRIYSPEYLVRLGSLCSEHNVLLIADEIAVGFGRTGRMFAFEHAGINPDIVCIGKGLSAGCLPISATIVKEKLFETFGDKPEDHTFYHGHTFAGNPIAAAVAIEVLNIYEKESIVKNADRLGRILKEEMGIFESLPEVSNVRCLGMIAAIELSNSSDTSLSPKEIQLYMLKRGILIRPLGNVVYLMLPLVTPEDLLRKTVKTLYGAVKNMEY